jgi:hypothetical protein
MDFSAPVPIAAKLRRMLRSTPHPALSRRERVLLLSPVKVPNNRLQRPISRPSPGGSPGGEGYQSWPSPVVSSGRPSATFPLEREIRESPHPPSAPSPRGRRLSSRGCLPWPPLGSPARHSHEREIRESLIRLRHFLPEGEGYSAVAVSRGLLWKTLRDVPRKRDSRVPSSAFGTFSPREKAISRGHLPTKKIHGHVTPLEHPLPPGGPATA